MNLLLDTHAYLWFTLDEPRLSVAAREQIMAPENQKFVSAASFWEVAIKIALGQYKLDEDFEAFWLRTTIANSISLLPIEVRHAARVVDLPQHHRDPFDRMIVAQALVDGLTLVSADSQLDAYGISRIS